MHPASPERLTPLDRRIVGALQVDGRASWRQIAEVLGEPERTVTRRGTALLQTGVVTVTALVVRGESVVLRMRCAPGTHRLAAQALANRPDTTFTYLLTGATDCVAEIICPPEEFSALVLDEIPAIPGMVACSTAPVIRYYRTVHDWQPALITDEEADALRPAVPVAVGPGAALSASGREDRLVMRALREDGRRTYEELGRIAGLSESTARRRVDRLMREGVIYIRAVVDPSVIGLPVEALLWLKVAPRHVSAVGEGLLSSPYVRYVSGLMGEHQLLADVTLPSKSELHAFISTGAWHEHVQELETSLVVHAVKRSGVRSTPSSRHD